MNILHLSQKQIENNIKIFEKGSSKKSSGKKPIGRYASFDFCFNYFQGFKNKKDLTKKENMQNSCLHIAFYLASWGMLRGSSFLLQKSIKFYENIIKYIAQKNDDFWKIDVFNYDDKNINELIKCYNDIKEILSEDGKNKVSKTQITKIMLGVFGNVPAFDKYFMKGSGLSTFNKNSLKEIHSFYKTNKKNILKKSKGIKTFNFDNGLTKNKYTQAKIIDMIFFIEGRKKNKTRKK